MFERVCDRDQNDSRLSIESSLIRLWFVCDRVCDRDQKDSLLGGRLDVSRLRAVLGRSFSRNPEYIEEAGGLLDGLLGGLG